MTSDQFQKVKAGAGWAVLDTHSGHFVAGACSTIEPLVDLKVDLLNSQHPVEASEPHTQSFTL